ncbi:MAG: thiamine-monophosphate kinase [Planctomycetota bacterium]|nr:MAG: thiamine-monophosphate kinase [Planctomycetota bacterium]
MSASKGEDQLHRLFEEAFRRRRGLRGPGDDCARLQSRHGQALAMSTDQVIPGVHTELDASPKRLAQKLLRRTLSDLAAAGATPWAVSWTAAAPPEKGMAWMKRLAKAFLHEAELFGTSVIGGDLSTAPAVVLTCTALGWEGRRPAPGRSGGRSGHWLVVTGKLGNAVRSGRHLCPEPRLIEGRLLVERYEAKAMIDLSDGLARDLPRLLEKSGLGAVVDLDALPMDRSLSRTLPGFEAAVSEGEDYELLAVLEPAKARRAFFDPILRKTGLHAIGELRSEPGLVWQIDGEAVTLSASGWQHDWK